MGTTNTSLSPSHKSALSSSSPQASSPSGVVAMNPLVATSTSTFEVPPNVWPKIPVRRLFVRLGCPFCARVVAFIGAANLSDRIIIEIADTTTMNYLVDKTGQAMYPALEVAPDQFLFQSYLIVEFFAKETGLNPHKLQVYQFYMKGIYPIMLKYDHETSADTTTYLHTSTYLQDVEYTGVPTLDSLTPWNFSVPSSADPTKIYGSQSSTSTTSNNETQVYFGPHGTLLTTPLSTSSNNEPTNSFPRWDFSSSTSETSESQSSTVHPVVNAPVLPTFVPIHYSSLGTTTTTTGPPISTVAPAAPVPTTSSYHESSAQQSSLQPISSVGQGTAAPVAQSSNSIQSSTPGATTSQTTQPSASSTPPVTNNTNAQPSVGTSIGTLPTIPSSTSPSPSPSSSETTPTLSVSTTYLEYLQNLHFPPTPSPNVPGTAVDPSSMGTSQNMYNVPKDDTTLHRPHIPVTWQHPWPINANAVMGILSRHHHPHHHSLPAVIPHYHLELGHSSHTTAGVCVPRVPRAIVDMHQMLHQSPPSALDIYDENSDNTGATHAVMSLNGTALSEAPLEALPTNMHNRPGVKKIYCM